MSSPDSEPQPYQISVPDSLLTWINDRVRTARIPPGKDLPAKDQWTHGVPVSTAQKLQDHWTQTYDWRRVEHDLNSSLHQFTLPITHNDETLTVHFVHHRSAHPAAIPLLFIHGWPGSFLEVRPIIDFLTSPSDPTTQQPYHVIAPSLPGFGFSSYPSKPFSPMSHAEVLHTLMHTLHYRHYVIQGGDWGSIIGRRIAIAHPTSCLGIHVNLVAAAPPSLLWHPHKLAKLVVSFASGWLATPFERAMNERMLWWQKSEFGYSVIQGTKSQTLQYALGDSPLGFVCWVRDKLEHLVDYEAGWVWKEEDVITLVMPYIINGSPGHAEIYRWGQGDDVKDMQDAIFLKIVPRSVAFGASIFPKDVIFAAKWWAEARVAENIVFWKEHDKGGHFPSLEVPDVLVQDVREFTKCIGEESLRKLRKD